MTERLKLGPNARSTLSDHMCYLLERQALQISLKSEINKKISHYFELVYQINDFEYLNIDIYIDGLFVRIIVFNLSWNTQASPPRSLVSCFCLFALFFHGHCNTLFSRAAVCYTRF